MRTTTDMIKNVHPLLLLCSRYYEIFHREVKQRWRRPPRRRFLCPCIHPARRSRRTVGRLLAGVFRALYARARTSLFGKHHQQRRRRRRWSRWGKGRLECIGRSAHNNNSNNNIKVIWGKKKKRSSGWHRKKIRKSRNT